MAFTVLLRANQLLTDTAVSTRVSAPCPDRCQLLRHGHPACWTVWRSFRQLAWWQLWEAAAEAPLPAHVPTHLPPDLPLRVRLARASAAAAHCPVGLARSQVDHAMGSGQSSCAVKGSAAAVRAVSGCAAAGRDGGGTAVA